MLEKVIHATNLSGIENLFNHEYANCSNYICASSPDCTDFMHRDVLFMLSGEVLERFSGDCGSDGHGNNIGVRNTTYDELHVSNNYEIEGLYWQDGKDLELYAGAWHYINEILQIPCNIINASQGIENQIKDYADDMEEVEFLEWLEGLGIENLIL